MQTLRAWVLVMSQSISESDTVFTAGDVIRDKHGFKSAIEVVGPYDVIVEITGTSIHELYKKAKLISNEDNVVSTTTFLAVDPPDALLEMKPDRVCMLIDTLPNAIDSVRKTLLGYSEVMIADVVLGSFDIVAVAQCKLDKLAGLLNKMLHTSGVVRTVSMFELPAQS